MRNVLSFLIFMGLGLALGVTIILGARPDLLDRALGETGGRPPPPGYEPVEIIVADPDPAPRAAESNVADLVRLPESARPRILAVEPVRSTATNESE